MLSEQEAEVKILFDNPPSESPVLSDEIQLMVKTIEFEQNRVATIKKWIKEDGMDKQEAKDLFQKQMDSMVRDALGLPDETEQERIYREKAAAVRDARLVEENADSEE